jgi:glycine cleavage system H protein
MTEYLQMTIDKFTFRVAKDRLYSSDGVWILPLESKKPTHVRVGVTDYFQQHNGDVAFAKIMPVETNLRIGEEFGELETMKVVVGLPSPISGTIVALNSALVRTPELINGDPYDKGWLAEAKVEDWDADRAKLLDPQAYLAMMRSQAEQELKS